MKKKILPFLLLMVLCFVMTGCAEEAPAFDYNKDIMIDMSKSLVQSYGSVTGLQADYLLEEGEEYEKQAVKGFQQLQKTDKVGEFVGFDTSDDVVKFENGSKGNILCTIRCKYENRDADVRISYTENKLFSIQKEQVINEITSAAISYGYTSADEYVKENLVGTGYNTDSASQFVDEYLVANNVIPYNADECEVTAVYSTSELLVNGAKNMGVGMGVVFAVLIFIAFIISLLKFVPRLLGREKKEQPKAKPVEAAKERSSMLPVAPVIPAASGKVPAAGEEVTDGELIAVITAALHAYLSDGSTGSTAAVHPPAYTESNDRLVVRSIRRVR